MHVAITRPDLTKSSNNLTTKIALAPQSVSDVTTGPTTVVTPLTPILFIQQIYGMVGGNVNTLIEDSNNGSIWTPLLTFDTDQDGAIYKFITTNKTKVRVTLTVTGDPSTMSALFIQTI